MARKLLGTLLGAGMALFASSASADNSEEADRLCSQLEVIVSEKSNPERTEAILKKNLAKLDLLPATDLRRLRAHSAEVRFYVGIKDTARTGEALRQVHQLLDVMIDSNMPEASNRRAYNECEMLADTFARRPFKRGGGAGTLKASDKDFAAAEALRLTAIKFADKLPGKDISRVMAYRSIVLWYRAYGREKQASEQTDKLAGILGSNKPEVLFPPPPPCPACGMG